MIDLTEVSIRQIRCPACDVPIGKPCVNYPSGRQASMSHSARYYTALDSGLLPTLDMPDVLQRPE